MTAGRIEHLHPRVERIGDVDAAIAVGNVGRPVEFAGPAAEAAPGAGRAAVEIEQRDAAGGGIADEQALAGRVHGNARGPLEQTLADAPEQFAAGIETVDHREFGIADIDRVARHRDADRAQ